MAGKNQAAARELQRAAEADRTRLQVIELDVTNTDSVERAIQTVVRETGRLDVLINNAGAAYVGITEGFTPEQAAAQFDVNVIGIHRTTRAALPVFRRQGSGLIINIGSIIGRITFPFFGLYGATKYALEALTEGYRYELSQLGIDVVLVQPSAYPTAMFANMQGPCRFGPCHGVWRRGQDSGRHDGKLRENALRSRCPQTPRDRRRDP